jgi:hypothetical protein
VLLRDQEIDIDPGPVGDLPERVARLSGQRPLARHEHQTLLARGTPQLVHRNAVLDQRFEQLLACSPLLLVRAALQQLRDVPAHACAA